MPRFCEILYFYENKILYFFRYLYWISRYSDLVRSVSNQVKRIPAGLDSRIPQQGTEGAGPPKQSSHPSFPVIFKSFDFLSKIFEE